MSGAHRIKQGVGMITRRGLRLWWRTHTSLRPIRGVHISYQSLGGRRGSWGKFPPVLKNEDLSRAKAPVRFLRIYTCFK